MLTELGLTPPSDPLPASPGNPKGYFEPVSTIHANGAMLAEAHSSWFDLKGVDWSFADAERRARWVESARASLRASFGDAGSIVLKEPRINRLWPIWRDALESEGFDIVGVLAGRDPAEVARSLHTRDDCALAYGGALWLRHTVAAEKASRGHPRVVIDYDDVIGDSLSIARRLAGLVSKSAEPGTGAGFIDPALRRSTPDAQAPDRLFVALSHVHGAFRRLVAADNDTNRAGFSQAAAEAERVFDENELVRRELMRVWPDASLSRKKATNWRRRARKAEKRLAEIEEGTSFVAKAPPDGYSAIPEAVVARVRDSGLFDPEWYLSRYPDVATSGVDPIRHYLAVGAALGHDPGPLFETDLYVRQMAAEGPKR